MALVSQSDLEAKLGRTLSTDEQSAFDTMNEAIQSGIEKMLGVSVESEDATTRYYDGGVQHLGIDLCTDISAVKIYNEEYNITETVDESDYTSEPYNKTLKHLIRFRYGRSYSGFNNIGVTAKFSTYGDDQATSIIKEAILDMLVDEIQDKTNIKRESIEGYSVEFGEHRDKQSVRALNSLMPPMI